VGCYSLSAVRKLSLETTTIKTEKNHTLTHSRQVLFEIFFGGGGYVHAMSDTGLISVHTRIAIFRVIVKWLQDNWNNSIYNSFTQRAQKILHITHKP